MACELPADSQVPLARWSSRELAREAVSPKFRVCVSRDSAVCLGFGGGVAARL